VMSTSPSGRVSHRGLELVAGGRLLHGRYSPDRRCATSTRVQR
jgi:hypothetical protein